uniref:Minor tail protein n=1 Tax=Dulem virus 35 TaxID=3145753 RepID=A0AAU8B2F6_9CAUD
MAKKADGSVYINTKLNTSGFASGMNSMESIAQRTAGKLKKIAVTIGGLFALHKIIDFGKESIKLGSDLAEVQNVVDVTFTSMSDKVDEFAAGAIKAYGLSETMAKRYVGTFGAMAKSFDFTESAAYNMATSLTGLAGDVASFYNITQDEAYTKLKSVFSGETETLKDLGVVMTQSALDAYAMEKGFGKTTAKMTEQEKVALRYSFVMEKLSGASGDFLRTQDSWANQTRVLNLLIEQLKANIGQSLITVLTPVIRYLNVIIEKLVTASTMLKRFTNALFSIETDSGGVKEIADSTGAAAGNMEDLAGATTDAQKAAKKALAPFDDLRQIKMDTAEETAAPSIDMGIGGGATSQEIKDTSAATDELSAKLQPILGTFEAIKNKAVELKDIFKTGFFEGLGDYKGKVEEIKSDLSSIGSHIIDIFTDPAVTSSFDNMIDSWALRWGRQLGAYVSIGLTLAQALIGGFESFLNNNSDRIKTVLVKLFDIEAEIQGIVGRFWVAFADVFSVFGSQQAQDIIGTILQIFFDAGSGVLILWKSIIRDLLDIILTPFAENAEKIKTTIINTFTPIQTVLTAIADTVRKTVDKIVKLYDEHIHPFFMSIRDGLSELLDKLLDAYNEHIVPVLDKLANKFKEVMEGPVGDAIDSAIQFIGKLVDALKLLWEEVLVPFINWVIDNVIPAVAPVIEDLGELLLDLFGKAAEFVDGVFDVLSGLIDFIVGAFKGDWDAAWKGLEEAFQGLQDMADAVFEGIIKIVEKVVGWIEKAVDALADLFKKGGDTSSIGGGYGGYSQPFAARSAYMAIPYQMPRLATGTVVPPRAGEFAAILGDNKRETEVVSPLSTIKQALKEAMVESGLAGGNRDIHIDMYVDRQRFASTVYKMNNEEKQRVGIRMVTQNG